jgi:hypothetical protein
LWECERPSILFRSTLTNRRVGARHSTEEIR